VDRSREHASKREKFSIRSLCEKLRWEREQGIQTGSESYAIPNELTRYIGIAIMRAYPDTEEHMTTKLPKPTESKRATIEQATAIAAWARECLTGREQKLVWCVDLRRDVGEPDAVGDVDGYNDRRWTETLSRLKAAILSMEAGENTTTDFGMIVACMVGVQEGESPQPVAVELSVPHMVDIGKLASKQPPVGRWRIMSEGEFSEASRNKSTPSSYFIDGIPF
tara:strand:+ start:2453 stop:3121 length:669 start_codon:yes stop_codon:yes gene_type:complete